MLTKYRAKILLILLVGGLILTVFRRAYYDYINLTFEGDGIEVVTLESNLDKVNKPGSKESKVAKWQHKQRMARVNHIKTPTGTSDKEAHVIKYGKELLYELWFSLQHLDTF